MKRLVALVFVGAGVLPLWADGLQETQPPELVPPPLASPDWHAPDKAAPLLPLPRPVVREPQPSSPDPVLPPPRLLPDDCGRRPSISPLLERIQQLKGEREALESAYEAANRSLEEGLRRDNSDTALLKLRVKELLGKLAKHRAASTPAPHRPGTVAPLAPVPTVPHSETPAAAPPPGSSAEVAPHGQRAPIDPLALGHALFRAGNYEGALQAYRMTELKGTRADERAPIQYLIACCLRRQGKTNEAAALLREVANVKGDEQIAVCARWQLAALRWQQEMQERLDEIRARRLALEKGP
jgi:tetratricopeptide (TPR) repeat protein